MKQLIIGCGYLGHQVAKIWRSRGDQVFTMTRSGEKLSDLKDAGYLPIQGDITDVASLSELKGIEGVDTVLFAVGMDRSRYETVREVYVDGLRNVLDTLIPNVQINHFIYISSTGVYGGADGAWLDENSPTEPVREGGIACLEAEGLLRQSELGSRTTLLRLAGIYGPGRVPTRSMIEQGKWSRLSAQGYVNLIHVEDGAQIVAQVADMPQTKGETYCVSDGNPPLRKDYYEFIAQCLGISSIPWEDAAVSGRNARAGGNKRISNQKLVDHLKYRFRFPSYQSGVQHAIDATSAE